MTITRKNQFEELIDAIILDQVAGFDQEIRETLEGLSTDKKRIAMLSILDRDRDMFMRIKKVVDGTEVSKVDHIKILVEQLRAYVTVGEFEKKSVGEVQTPWTLVQDLINCYPQEVWTNPNLKWLDNSTGTGILIAGVVERLMDGLSKWEPDQEKRYAHIMENMIHVAELQAKNCFIYLCSYDPKDEYELNIYHGSFLDDKFEEHAKTVWGVENFDCIIANPPYQTSNPGEKKTHPIWDKFVKKSLEVLVEGGYMVNVHPSGWRNVDGRFKDTQVLLRSKQMMYLEIHSFKDGLKTFGAKIDYDFYCIKNIDSDKNFLTTVKCVNEVVERVNILGMEFIPAENIELVHSFVAKPGEERVEILSDSSYHTQRTELMSKEQSLEFEHPCVYMVKYGLNVVFWYSKLNKNVHFGIPKVIWGNGATDVLVDDKGQYGLTQFAYAIVDEMENLENIKKALDNPRFVKDVMGYRDGLGDKYNRKIIATFRKDFWKDFSFGRKIQELQNKD